MKHVLITGGAGFIGSHLCDELLRRGYAVTAVDNFVTGRMDNIKDAKRNRNFRFLEWDVCDPLPLDEQDTRLEFLGMYGLQGVLHFACPASPVDFDRIPFEILEVDSLGTIHTVDLALRYGARYVLASTSEIYGDPLVHPQTEDYWGNVNTVGPRSCYDEAKRFAEAYVYTATRRAPALRAATGAGRTSRTPANKLDAGIVRIFNTYGPRMRPDDGRVVPELCIQALKGEPLTIHGDGLQTRSFCFVTDLVEGILRLFESREPGPFNIGNPVERTVLDFAETTRRLAGTRSSVSYLGARTDDPRRRCPDISRAQSQLGWSPRVDLEEGLKRTLEYFRTQL